MSITTLKYAVVLNCLNGLEVFGGKRELKSVARGDIMGEISVGDKNEI